MRLSLVGTAVSLSLIGLATAQSARAAMREPTEIPPQQLELALQALAQERNFQVIYRSEVVGQRTSGGATGNLTQSEALDQLLDKTGLTYRYLDDHTVTILQLAEAREIAAAASIHPSGAPATQAGKGAQKSPSFWDRFAWLRRLLQRIDP
jgi:iron complex outermembrane recepter protein